MDQGRRNSYVYNDVRDIKKIGQLKLKVNMEAIEKVNLEFDNMLIINFIDFFPNNSESSAR